MTTKLVPSMLMLEKGTQRVTFDELSQVVTPDPTETWMPIAHTEVLNSVTDTLGQLNFHVRQMELAVAQEGGQF
ncbi:MAG: hypothetical protein KC653_00630, partial [Candidatus Andersenbacteria bacterium]|nr:hypothetical protein [Candidatus Andersenbacteria bacterium]